MSYQQEAENERYESSLTALTECLRMGVGSKAMETLRFELAINPKDYRDIQDNEITFLEEQLHLQGAKS